MASERPRAVFDTMVLFQWVALPSTRQHGTDRAVAEGRVVQCLGRELVEEIAAILARPGIRAKSEHLTDERITGFLEVLHRRSEWFESVPPVFSFLAHTKDDHLFNLAIAARAEYLVTWETRLLGLEHKHPEVAARLRELSPGLRIVDPPRFMTELRLLREGSGA